ncbi:MAG: hypothetical protein EOO43_21960 [Flavobacterium sp.]|nr:MAG: hypothetical protein EOO43_21960 [Flavobacterium sp.]
MSKPFQIEDISEGFAQQFPSVVISHETVPFMESKANAFFVTYTNEVDLAESWFKVSNYIAIYFVSKIDTEFEKWNTYLFYRCNTGIPRQVQYKIENDTFGSRKICINNDETNSEIT